MNRWNVFELLSIPLVGLLLAWTLLSAEFNAIGALLIIAVGALVAAPVSVYCHPAMHAVALACGICFVIGGVIGVGVVAIGYWGESRDIGPSIFPLHIAVPIVSSLFTATAIILVKRWRGSPLLDVRER